MKKAAFLILTFCLPLLASGADSTRFRVIKVHTPLSMGDQPADSASANDYYVTIGAKHGLRTGTVLNTYRNKQIEDEATGVTITTRIFVGRLRAIQVQDEFCIARVAAMAGNADPLRERDAVLVGDYVLPTFVIQGEQLFGKGSGTLLPGALKVLEEATQFLKTLRPNHAVVEGHTDNDGSPVYNLKLSELRASAVRDYLINHGKIDASLLTPVGCGESRPIAPNDSPQGQAMNRRFEIIVDR